MSYLRVSASYPAGEQVAVAIPGGGVGASLAFTTRGGVSQVTLIATVACFIRINGAAANAAGSTGFPLPANVPLTLTGQAITSIGVNGATAGTLCAWGAA
ncbi:MAG: hypothetical protein C0498_01375 [Anaerolinea sp.]|nr:hypothetical protein [Anaerolinea sp.]